MHCTVYRRKPFIPVGSVNKYDNIKFVDLVSTKISGFETLFHTFIACLHIIIHRNADIVNIHNIGPGLFTPLLRLFRFKVVLTYHSPNYEHAKWGFLAKTILRIGEFLALHFANRIIFVNKFQMAKYSKTIQSRSIYIPNGINNVSPSKETDFLATNGIKPDSYVLAVGRLTPEKDFETLIKAVNLSSIKTLVIAGDTDHKPEYAEYLKKLDTGKKVIFTGFTTGEPLRQLYSHARLFVLSSTTEGFPIVLLEALSYKLPVIVTDIPATHLIKLPDDSYTPAGNIEQMISHIEHKYFQSDSSQNDYTFLNDYSWDAIASQTAQIYYSL